MLVGVNTIPATARTEASEGGYLPNAPEERYLRCALDTARMLQNNTHFIVYTHDRNHEVYHGWDRVQVGLRACGINAWSGRNSALDRAVHETQADVLFSPLESAPPLCAVPQVIYSLNIAPWEEAAGGAPFKGGPSLKTVKRACATARALLVPSEYARRKCLDLFEAPLDKSIVAPAGVSPTFEKPSPTMIEKPYMVLFSDPLSVKNIPGIRKTLNSKREELPPTLVVAGPGSGSEPEHWGPGVVRIEKIPDNHLAGLYQNSALFIYPALYDGTAMRVLEALRAGACVVTPNSGAVTELAGDAPFYYNPESAGSFIQAVRWAMEQSQIQNSERIRLGRRAAAAHSWEKTAWKILSAFRRV
jgi:glycosyltransferase involved in cell wall biosynthesis